jgi:glutathione peroxidase
MTKIGSFLQVLFTILSVLVVATSAIDPDKDEQNCPYWSSIGECDKNPGFMIPNCATSCDKVAKQALKDADELQSVNSFFDLKSTDIHGREVAFAQFKGQVTVVVNVASECGYTDSHYRSLVKLWKQLDQYSRSAGITNTFNILAFPCNQFGQQEPGSSKEILDFVNEYYGVDSTTIRLMSKVDVNGAGASLVYKYLKSKAGPASITWNFATYYVVGPDGSVEAFSGVEPIELKDTIVNLGKSSDEL